MESISNLKLTDAEKKTIQTTIDNILPQLFNPDFQQELRARLVIEDCLSGIPDKKERAEKIIDSFKSLEIFIINAQNLAGIVLDIMEDL